MNENQSDLTQRITQESHQPQRIRREDKAYQSVLDIEERLQKGNINKSKDLDEQITKLFGYLIPSE